MLSQNAPSKADTKFNDLIQPFLVDQTHVHGRFVRLGDAVDTIISRHHYPAAVSHILGEQLVLTALLSRALKHEGIITFQVRGDGPVRLMVTDVTAHGVLRGYADVDMEKLAALGGEPQGLASLFGQGYLCITVDHGLDKQPYQGIVELDGGTLTECCLRYLHQSEQFKVHIKTSVAQAKDKGWQAGGILIQRLPEDEHSHQIILPQPMEKQGEIHPETKADAWERTCIFVDSLTRQEITDVTLAPRELLYRLFHDDGVWVYESAGLSAGCRCSRERIEGVLRSLPAQDINDLVVQDKITVTCQFCNKDEVFESTGFMTKQ